VRNRIFEVLRFGTPIKAAYQSRESQKNKSRVGIRGPVVAAAVSAAERNMFKILPAMTAAATSFPQL
jgi:hypothetical protein